MELYSGKPFPLNIDSQFEDLANFRTKEDKIFSYFILPTKRLINLWLNPYYSHGWPISLEKKLNNLKIDYKNKNFVEKFNHIKIFPIEISLKIFFFAWSLILLTFFFLSFFVKKNRNIKFLSRSCLYLISIKTLFFIHAGFFETRYISNLIPLIEISVILVFSEIIVNPKKYVKFLK